MKKKLIVLGCIAAVSGAIGTAAAAERFGASLQYGWSNDSNTDVDMYQGGVQYDFGVQWLKVGNWHVGAYAEFTVGYWDNKSPRATHASIWDVGLTPVLRIQQTDKSIVSPFLEGGIGIHYLSETSVSARSPLRLQLLLRRPRRRRHHVRAAQRVRIDVPLSAPLECRHLLAEPGHQFQRDPARLLVLRR